MYYKVYGKDGCEYCTLAVELLEVLRKDYIYLVLNEDYCIEDFKEIFPNATTVPQVIETTSGRLTKIGGYTELKQHLGQ